MEEWVAAGSWSYSCYQECLCDLIGDEGESELEVGDALYPMVCEFAGEISARVMGQQLFWSCPQCGAEHEQPFEPPEVDDRFDAPF